MQVATTHFATTLAKQKQPHTMSMHLEFVRRTQIGPAVFTVKDVKLGRATSTIHVTLSQNGQDEVLAYMTNSDIAGAQGVSFDTEFSLHPSTTMPTSLDAMANGNDPYWQERPNMPFTEFRKAARQVQFFFPNEGQQHASLADQWIKFKSGERFTNASLGFVADMFSQIPENYRAGKDVYSPKIEKEGSVAKANEESKKNGWSNFWYPTLLLNLDVKKVLPEEGIEFIFSRTSVKQVKNGRYDIEVVILDETGDLVALSHHVCMILSSERNTSKRKPQGKL